MPNGMGAHDGYQQQWSQQGMNNGQPSNPMSIDTGMAGNVARSMPATPATTPPGPNVQNMHASYPPVSQAYDNSRTLYNPSSTQQASNAQQSNNTYPPINGSDNRGMYSHTGYIKNEMGPPSSRPVGGHGDSKTSAVDGYQSQGEQTSHAQNEEEAEHEHDGEYTHDNSGYDATRNSYYNSGAPAVGSMSSEHQQQIPDMNGSPHQPASGRATPRTAQPPQSYYPNQQGYSTPPQPQQSSRALDYSDSRVQTNGTTGGDHYAPQPELHGSMQNGYPSQPSMATGASVGMKRGRDDEDESSELKRRKTLTGYDMINRPMAAIPSGQRISR
jgi:protein SOK2